MTETAVLALSLDGIEVGAIYTKAPGDLSQRNRIPYRLIDDFKADCEFLLLMEPLPAQYEEKIKVRKRESYLV